MSTSKTYVPYPKILLKQFFYLLTTNTWPNMAGAAFVTTFATQVYGWCGIWSARSCTQSVCYILFVGWVFIYESVFIRTLPSNEPNCPTLTYYEMCYLAIIFVHSAQWWIFCITILVISTPCPLYLAGVSTAKIVTSIVMVFMAGDFHRHYTSVRGEDR